MKPWGIRLERHEEGAVGEEVISEKSLKLPQLFGPQTLASSVNE